MPSSLASKVPRREEGPTDETLVAAARQHDQGAKEALVRRHVTMAHSLAYRLLGHDSELEDLVQDSFAAAFASLHRLDQGQAFRAWFSAIVTGTVIATIRRRRLLSRLGLARPQPLQLDTLISSSAPPDVTAELRAIYEVVESLPTQERVVLILRRVEQLGLEDIVRQTGWSLATVKRSLSRATDRLEKRT